MNLPKSGRVVVIDDESKDALPLIKVLSRQKISTTYFSGRIEELPNKHFTDVRIVFLDIVLEGMSGREEEKIILSVLYKVIEKIISPENGPFILILWTKHDNYNDTLEKMLKNQNYQPILLNLQKTECMKEDNDEYDLEKISTKIEEKLKKVGIYDIFLLWENIVHDSVSTTINEFSQLIKFDDNWNAEMVKIYYNLAKAWVGQHIDSIDSKEILRNALFTFKGIFEDNLEKNIKNTETIPEIVFLEKNMNQNLKEDIKAKINSKLLLDIDCKKIFPPGCLYFIEDCNNSEKEILINDAINKTELNKQYKQYKKSFCGKKNDVSKNEFEEKFLETLSDKIELIQLEVTPFCDYIQKKMKVSRLVKGFLCPIQISFDMCGTNLPVNLYGKNSLIKQHTQFLYLSPIFEYKGKQYFLILDFRHFTSSKNEKMQNKKILFRLRKDILSEIQVKLSSHINRTGVLYL